MTEKFLSLSDMDSARCSQANFGRLVGLSRSRICQLVRAGLIPVDSGGVKIVDAWRMARIHYDLSVEEFFQRFSGRF